MGRKGFIVAGVFAQQRLWFLEQLDPGKSVYNMRYGVRFETRLNLGALEHSLNEIVRRHESLRTTFSTKDEKPVQVIAKEMSVELPVIDLSGVSNSERERETRRWSEHEAEQTFDLAAGPLLRVRLLRLAAEENVLLVALHHIVSDGWSMGVFFFELATVYEAFSANRAPTLPDLPIHYPNSSLFHRNWLHGEV